MSDEPPEFDATRCCPRCMGPQHRSATVFRYGRSMATTYACEKCGETEAAVYQDPADAPAVHAHVRRQVTRAVLSQRPLEAAR